MSTTKWNDYMVEGPDGTLLGTYSCKNPNMSKINYLWKIPNYSSHDAKDKDLLSPVFTSATTDLYKWSLVLEPNGVVGNKQSVLIGLYLHFRFGYTVASVKWNMFILDSQEKKIILPKLGARILKFNEKCLKLYSSFIFKNELTEDFLPNDQLTIYLEAMFYTCDITMYSYEQSFSNHLDCHLLKHDLSADLERLFISQDFADVVISANGKCFQAHKFILSARSPVFAAMLKHDTKESKNNRVEITDIDEEIIDEMLYYMYTGKFKDLDSVAIGLLKAADKYAMEDMKAKCENALLRNLSVENAADILVLADLHRADELKSRTISFIISKSTKVMDTETWKKILDSYPHLINEVCRRALAPK